MAQGPSKLAVAARTGDLEQIRKLPHTKRTLGGMDGVLRGDGKPFYVPLHQAAANGQAEACRVLVEECGADVDHRDCSGFTPLMRAVWDGHDNAAAVIDVLLALGADATARRDKQDVLTDAVDLKRTKLIPRLLAAFPTSPRIAGLAKKYKGKTAAKPAVKPLSAKDRVALEKLIAKHAATLARAAKGELAGTTKAQAVEIGENAWDLYVASDIETRLDALGCAPSVVTSLRTTFLKLFHKA